MNGRKQRVAGLFVLVVLMLSVFQLASYGDYDFLSYPDRKYVNEKYGFEFLMDGFCVDDSYEDVKTVFYNGTTFVDVYYNDFTGTIHNSSGYVGYSNSQFENNEYVTVDSDRYTTFGGYPARVIQWHRKPLKYAKYRGQDYTYYALVDIVRNNKEVYTIQINSAEAIDCEEYMRRFHIIPKDDAAGVVFGLIHRFPNHYWNEETKRFYEEEFHSISKTKFGFFEHSTRDSLAYLQSIEGRSNNRFDYLLEYYSMASEYRPEHLQELYNDGRILQMTLQTSTKDFTPMMLYEILDGKYDEKIVEIAKYVNSVDGPVFFRLNNEMNGDWCCYNALHYNRDTRLYKALWRYIHDTICEYGGGNVIFVFNPNGKSFPDFKWNHYVNYFAGSDYVDVVGATGYNTGSYYVGETWQSFQEIYDAFMPEYQERFRGYDFYITEYGSNTIGGNREEWFAAMLEHLNDYGFKVAIYWNGTDWDGETPARIYRIDNDDKILKMMSDYSLE